MSRRTNRAAFHPATIFRAGDAATLVRFGTAISADANARVMALLRALDRTPPPGLRDLVPAYASLLVLFDPLVTSHADVEAQLRSLLHTTRVRATAAGGQLARIPVLYGGDAGPDLDEVARLVGLAPEEVVRRHASAEYRVAFLGFLAGFPYLSGLPTALAVPRLPTPRTQVPAGSVALAGQQTGIYPVAAPGGWRLIGRTTMPLFDPARHPPSLLRPGDRVRFEPIRTAGSASPVHPATQPSVKPTANPATAPEPDALPWLAVRVPGPLTTVQDLGRPGFARYGVSASGAADADAFQLGNLLLGNPRDAAALELTLGGCELEALTPCVIAVTGAECPVQRNGRAVQPGAALALQTGDTLRIEMARVGARAYLCVAGGIATPPVLGSRSTDLRASLGGADGRALRAGDTLWRGPSHLAAAALAGRALPTDPVRVPTASRPCTVRILPGPHAVEAAADLAALQAGVFTVSPRADRVGVRLQPLDPSGRCAGGETISEGVPRGAVQVPPDGEPVILLADHQTTGGYRVPAVVVSADLWRVAQVRPGDTVRFALVTLEAAVAALRERDAWLARLADHEALSHGARYALRAPPDTALLMRGFLEWSDEGTEEAHDDE